MISGKVTANREAALDLEVFGHDWKKVRFDTATNRGYNGGLPLPTDFVSFLDLLPDWNRIARMGGENKEILDVYLEK